MKYVAPEYEVEEIVSADVVTDSLDNEVPAGALD